MIQRCEYSRFTRKACKPLGILRDGRRQHLNRDIAVEFGVPCAIDHTHTTGAQLVDDAVVRNGIARDELDSGGEQLCRWTLPTGFLVSRQ
jgi:hypothetical protein